MLKEAVSHADESRAGTRGRQAGPRTMVLKWWWWWLDAVQWWSATATCSSIRANPEINTGSRVAV